MADVLLIALLSFIFETISDRFLMPPLDVGYEPGTPWYIQLLGAEWVIVHLPWLYSLDGLERASGCHDGNVVAGCSRVDISLISIGGFIDTTLLLALALACVVKIQSIFRRRIPSP